MPKNQSALTRLADNKYYPLGMFDLDYDELEPVQYQPAWIRDHAELPKSKKSPCIGCGYNYDIKTGKREEDFPYELIDCIIQERNCDILQMLKKDLDRNKALRSILPKIYKTNESFRQLFMKIIRRETLHYKIKVLKDARHGKESKPSRRVAYCNAVYTADNIYLTPHNPGPLS
jgi:hypothetical protein